MSCHKHQNKESIANCQFCGKELCEDCTISIAGKNYCEDCMIELVGPEIASIASGKTDEILQTNAENKTLEDNQIPVEQTQEKTLKIDDNVSQIDDDELHLDMDGKNDTTPPNNEIEEKYERYLDDLYFDETPDDDTIGNESENEISLGEQLAQEEAEHGSITQKPFVPDVPKEPEEREENELEDLEVSKHIPILKNLKRLDSEKEKKGKGEKEEKDPTTPFSLHENIIRREKEGKKSFSSTEIILTIILIILIILVLTYIIYLLTLQSQYPSFLNAITSFFGNPGEVIGAIFS